MFSIPPFELWPMMQGIVLLVPPVVHEINGPVMDLGSVILLMPVF
jgi:hypothetical protein